MTRYLLILLCCCNLWACHRKAEVHVPLHIPFLQQASAEVDSLLKVWTIEQKIAQLILFQPQLNNPTSLDTLLQMGQAGYFGGLLLRDLPFQQFLQYTDSLQHIVPYPLFIATDEAISLNNQFSDLAHFPKAATLAAISNDSIEAQLQDLFLKQCEAGGINFCIGPTLNPVERVEPDVPAVFDSDPDAVLHSSSKRLEELQAQRILSVARDFNHFYHPLPDSSQIIDSLLNPYYNLSHNGLSGLLIDKRLYQKDSLDGLPANYLRDYLEKQLDFQGLIVSSCTAADQTLRNVVRAGTHIFLTTDAPNLFADSLKSFLEEGLLTEYSLDERVRKVLMAKNWSRQDCLYERMDLMAEEQLFRNDQFKFHIRNFYESALTLANDSDSLIPFDNIHQRRFRLIEVGDASMTSFRRVFEKYAPISRFKVPYQDSTGYESLNPAQFKRSTLVVSLNEVSLTEKEDNFVESLNAMAASHDIVLLNWSYPLNLLHFDPSIAMVQLFEQQELNESLVAQMLFGGLPAKGRFPLNMADHLTRGKSLERMATRLKYTIPEDVGIAAYKLVSIDAIVQQAIRLGAFPGAQVLVAKEGKVIYHKSFGKHHFTGLEPVKQDNLYDLASVTKIASTTLAAMKLYEQKAFKINERIGPYINCEKKQAIGKLSFKRLLTHQSGLQSNMPIAPFIMLEDTLNNPCNDFFCKIKKSPTDIQIADSMFMAAAWSDSIWQEVYQLKPSRRKRFRYSDVNFNLIQRFIETKTKTSLDQYVSRHFYAPLSMRRTAFRPLEKFKDHEIVPTTNDEKWRKQLLRGYVHDESAALFGGVGGNSGLFSTTQDLAVLFQMLLNGGNYGGHQYLNKTTIDFFTASKHGNHRGLGFDKQTKKGNRTISAKASRQTYGHTGYTGTCVWVDPKEELVFIFLTNRICPDVGNKKIFKHKIRKRIHNVIYEALDSYTLPTDLMAPIESLDVDQARAAM